MRDLSRRVFPINFQGRNARARQESHAHTSGTHVGERIAERNDNGYGYGGPLENGASRG